MPDRKALTGILFVLKTGIQWEDLPQEMGCGCGMTCWLGCATGSLFQTIAEVLLGALRSIDVLLTPGSWDA